MNPTPYTYTNPCDMRAVHRAEAAGGAGRDGLTSDG